MLHYINAQGDGHAPLNERDGLGLWMVKRLSRESGGRLSARRKETGGTIVQLVVPEIIAGRGTTDEASEERRDVA
jgi:two-component sensor histidine kinase